jgi:hypothetical protein
VEPRRRRALVAAGLAERAVRVDQLFVSPEHEAEGVGRQRGAGGRQRRSTPG